jgi:hypothetical protein
MKIDANFIFELITLIIAIGGIAVTAGTLINQINNLKERQDEDREKNASQHKEFFDATGTQSKQIVKFEIIMQNLEKNIVDLKAQINKGFNEVNEKLERLRG